MADLAERYREMQRQEEQLRLALLEAQRLRELVEHERRRADLAEASAKRAWQVAARV